MAKRKTPPKRKTRRRPRKRNLFKSPLVKAFVGIALLALVVVFVGFLLRFLIAPEKPAAPPAVPSPIPTAKIPKFEIYPPKEIPPEKKPVEPTVPGIEKKPRVAIIIDDLGYDVKIAKNFSELHAAITFSILPHSPFKKKIARIAQDKGFDIMLHLPMEPIEYPEVNPGPGTLLTSMTPDELIRQLEKDLDSVPSIKGVNNHMGSRMTAQSGQLYQIFSILKARGLYFIDSRTTTDTLCKPSARLFQIPFAERDVFLDHLQEADFIRKQIKELIRIARNNGHAVGIGHPHSVTYEVLREMLPELQQEVVLVPASEVVNPIG